jgi:hypothetical protein
LRQHCYAFLLTYCVSPARAPVHLLPQASGIVFQGNTFDSPFYPSVLGGDTNASTAWSGYSFHDTVYWSSAPSPSWFETQRGGRDKKLSLAEWDALVNGHGSSAKQPAYVDPTRSLESYTSMNGGASTYADVLTHARVSPCAPAGSSSLSSSAAVATPFTADAVNTYLRGGFAPAV